MHDLNFLLKRCVFIDVSVCVFVFFCIYSIKKETSKYLFICH